jgi:predicted transposase YbfD/YdcC
MDAQATGGFLRFFRDLPDPRAANAVHRLDDILIIAVCAVICGADTWVDVETFGNAKLPWLSTFLTLPRGVPSHDTFGRVFAALDPDAFERCFQRWMAALREPGTRLVAIDGKSIRRSFAHAWDASGMAHLVSAFAAENRLSFAQVAAAEAGQELAAMRRLLDLLALDEATVVTIDALGCQRDVARQIVARDADYVLAVRANQPTLHAAVKRVLDEALLEKFRGHWGIENSLHWQLDVSFGEDLRRVRKDHAAENFSRLCRIALNLLKSEKTARIGVKGKRLKAGWDEPYLLRLLTG